MSLPPIYISFAIAHHVSPDPETELGYDHYNSGAGKKVRNWLREEGLIDSDGQSTPRLHAWLEHLGKQPLPEQFWIVPTAQQDRDDG